MARRRARGVSGRQLTEQVRQRLASGWPPGLTVLTGQDLYHLDLAQRELLAALVPEEASDFALTVLRDAKTKIVDVVAMARALPMFGSRRVVFVGDLSVLDGEAAPLDSYAADPPAGSFLLVRAPKLDLRRTLHKQLAKLGVLLDFGDPERLDPRELAAVAVEMAADRGLKLERRHVGPLIESAAGDLYRMASELDKVDAWIGAGETPRKITDEALAAVTGAGGLLSGWELANAVLLREADAAFSAARRLLDSGEEPLRLLGGLAWRARTMLQAKALLERGRSAEQVVRQLRAWGYRDELNRGLRRYRLDELIAFPAHLLRADRALKGSRIDPRTVVEDLVRRLLGAPAEALSR